MSICSIVAVLFSYQVASAQHDVIIMNYSMGLGAGKTGQFISSYSWRGIGFDYRHVPQPEFGYGLSMGWNTFYRAMPLQTYNYKTIAATGYQYRYFNSFPIMAAADYFIKPDEKTDPYIGLGVGIQYNIATTDFGIYRFEDDAVPFSFAPEIGALIHLRRGEGFNIGIKWVYGFKTSSLPTDSHFLFNLGFLFGG